MPTTKIRPEFKKSQQILKTPSTGRPWTHPMKATHTEFWEFSKILASLTKADQIPKIFAEIRKYQIQK